MSYDDWKTTDPRDSEPDYDATLDCNARGLEHRWELQPGGTTVCVDCHAVCDTNNEQEESE